LAAHAVLSGNHMPSCWPRVPFGSTCLVSGSHAVFVAPTLCCREPICSLALMLSCATSWQRACGQTCSLTFCLLFVQLLHFTKDNLRCQRPDAPPGCETRLLSGHSKDLRTFW
jgi:hypothetical protein